MLSYKNCVKILLDAFQFNYERVLSFQGCSISVSDTKKANTSYCGHDDFDWINAEFDHSENVYFSLGMTHLAPCMYILCWEGLRILNYLDSWLICAQTEE